MEWGRGCATLMKASEVTSEAIRVERGKNYLGPSFYFMPMKTGRFSLVLYNHFFFLKKQDIR